MISLPHRPLLRAALLTDRDFSEECSYLHVKPLNETQCWVRLEYELKGVSGICYQREIA